MQVTSAISSAMLGYQQATASLTDAAQAVALQTVNQTVPAPSSQTVADPATSGTSHNITAAPVQQSIDAELLTMHNAMYNGMAALKVLRSADEMLGTSIDVSV